MATSWTLERRQRQAELIRSWKPWEQSTGPKTPEGKKKVANNANRGDVRGQLRTLSKALNAELAEMKRLERLARR